MKKSKLLVLIFTVSLALLFLKVGLHLLDDRPVYQNENTAHLRPIIHVIDVSTTTSTINNRSLTLTRSIVEDGPLSPTQQDEPLSLTEQDQPLSLTQQDQPLSLTQQDQKLSLTQQDQPLSLTQQDQKLSLTQQDQPLSPTQQENVPPFVYSCSDTITDEDIHLGVIVTNSYRQKDSSLSILVLLKSVVSNRHLPLHLHFLSDSKTNKTIHKLLSTWSIPYFKWTVYSPQTESIPSIIHGHILLNLLLPPTVPELIVMSIEALVVQDLGELWLYLQRHKSKTRAITINDFQSNVLLLKRLNVSSFSHDDISMSEDVDILSANDITTVFSELSFVISCDGARNDWCQSHVISKQMDTTTSYDKIHSTLKFDGNIEENLYRKCDEKMTFEESKKLDVDLNGYCDSLTRIAEYKFRSLINFFGHHYESSDIHDVTLVTQVTFDRISRLSVLLSHWSGPVSIAIYTVDQDIKELYNYLKSSSIISERAQNSLSIHVVFNHSMVYPINYIRNVALDAVTTQYVFLSDFDFLPNFDSYHEVKNAIARNKMAGKKIALVIPAFETVEKEITFPNSKEELLTLITRKKVQQFHVQVWRSAHGSTKYNEWKQKSTDYSIVYRTFYEPYVVVRSDVVRYDTRFVGFGWNKVSHIMELHVQSYKFIVLANAFIVHMWHPVSVQKEDYFKDERFRIWDFSMTDYIADYYEFTVHKPV